MSIHVSMGSIRFVNELYNRNFHSDVDDVDDCGGGCIVVMIDDVWKDLRIVAISVMSWI